MILLVCGLWYNETADQLARAAELIGPMQLHPSDFRNNEERQLEKIRLPETMVPQQDGVYRYPSSDIVLTKDREAKQHASSLRG
ncbi:hypothetical protein OS493_014475 [Desmophyllum pertusum]|uniref:Uncharacterized protein n=1 Tax=Desmophyllum pertusum TaxID=174260 RepID=A0A9W9YSQ5_9CNID|nr:hypothetical protein OS493_014475 [Desmophyllum pertusum]